MAKIGPLDDILAKTEKFQKSKKIVTDPKNSAGLQRRRSRIAK